jgi:hypothetical protein
MRTKFFVVTILWLAVSVFSANAEECFSCAKPGDITTLRGRSMQVGEAVQVLNGLCGLSGITVESFVKANKNSLGDYTDSSQWIELHVGQVIMIPADAVVVEAKKAEVIIAPNFEEPRLECSQTANGDVKEDFPFRKSDYTACHYTVGAGDQLTLVKLAVNFRQPLSRFEFFNPRLRPNKKLLPGTVVAISNNFFTYWAYVNVLPVGKKDVETLRVVVWPKFQDLSENAALIDELTYKYNHGDYRIVIIKSGLQNKQWTSGAKDGRGRIIKDSVVVYDHGVCAYPELPLLFGQEYKLNNGMRFVMAYSCYNWIELLDGEILPGPEPVIPPPIVVVPTPIIPPVVKVVEPTPTPCPPCPPPLKVDNSWHSLYMVDLWAGASLPPDDKSSNYNGGGLWYQMWQKGLSAQRYGFALKVAGWHGNDHCNTSWDGGEFSVGPLAMLSFNQKHIFWGIEPIGMGGKYSWSRTVPADSNHVYETNPLFCHMQTLNVFGGLGQLAIWFEGDMAWMKKTQKESWRNGSQLFQSGTTNPDSLDAVDNNSKLSLEVKYLIGPNEWIAQPLIFGSTNYTFDNRIPKTNDLGVGVAFGHGAYQLKAAYENGFSKYHSSENTYIISIDGNIGWFPWIYND